MIIISDVFDRFFCRAFGCRFDEKMNEKIDEKINEKIDVKMNEKMNVKMNEKIKQIQSSTR